MLRVSLLCPGTHRRHTYKIKLEHIHFSCSFQEKLGTVNQGRTFAVYNYEAQNDDEASLYMIYFDSL